MSSELSTVELIISVTIAAVVLLAFVVYSGLTLATLDHGVGRTRHRLAIGLPLTGAAGMADQLTGTCPNSRNATMSTTAGNVATAEPAAADPSTAEQPIPRQPYPPRIAWPGDRVTDPVGEPPPLLWLRDHPGTKGLTQSGNGDRTSESD